MTIERGTAMRTALAVALLAMLLLGEPVANSRAAHNRADALPSARILFQRGNDLWVARADGSHARRFAKQAGQAAVSPDARRIAFVRARSIWVMKRDGSGQERLTRGPEAISPAWSPDAETIYFSRRFEGKDKYGGYVFAFSIYRMDPDGGAVRQLTHPEPWDHGTCDSAPAPSPDGRIIAYESIGECDRGYDASIEAVNGSGLEVSLTPFAVGAGFDPAWSSDGRRLAFASVSSLDFGTGTGIGVAAADGKKPRRLYRGGPASGPAWSPDGRWLAFSTDGNVWLVRSDGSGLRRVLRTGLWRSDPAWLSAAR